MDRIWTLPAAVAGYFARTRLIRDKLSTAALVRGNGTSGRVFRLQYAQVQDCKKMITLVTFSYGILITCLGIVSYFVTGQASKTALIPCVFGLPIIALAIATWIKPNIAKKSTILATIIAFLALGGTVRGLMGAIALVMGTEIARPSAAIAQGIMAIASLSYILYVIGISWSKGNRHKS